MAEQRLIDANNLIEEIREERCYNCRNFKDMKCDYCGMADYIYMIEDMPTADVAPVVHGRWELEYKTYGKMRCSVCKKEALIEKAIGDVGIITTYVDSNYCPHCGARMDGKENDK